jgi:hypothetical protein
LLRKQWQILDDFSTELLKNQVLKVMELDLKSRRSSNEKAVRAPQRNSAENF